MRDLDTSVSGPSGLLIRLTAISSLSVIAIIACISVIGLIGAVWTMSTKLLPAPTGPYAVGADDHSLASATVAASPCPLRTRIWYPISDRTQVRQIPYSPEASLISARRWATISVAEGVPPTSAVPHLPVILFLPGWAGGMSENTSLVTDLASRGFVVVAVGYDDGTCSGLAPVDKPLLDLSSEAAFQRTQSIAHTRFERTSLGVSRLIDGLVALNRATSSSPFAGRLDLSRLATVGHSFGGAMAVEICSRDSRVTAAVNIDGWLFGAGGSGGITQPWLVLNSSGVATTASDLTSEDSYRRYSAMLEFADSRQISAAVASGRARSVTLDDTEHSSFADFPYLSWRDLLRPPAQGSHAISRAAEEITAFLKESEAASALSPTSRPPGSLPESRQSLVGSHIPPVNK